MNTSRQGNAANQAKNSGFLGFGQQQSPRQNSTGNNSKKSNSYMNSARSMLENRAVVIGFIVLAFVAIIGIIVFIIYKLRHSDLQNVVLQAKPLKLFDMDEPKIFEKDKLVPTHNGQEFSYSFWIYLIDYDSVTSTPRFLFMRNSDDDYALGGANPVVFMDGKTNRMFIALRTNASPTTIGSLSALMPSESRASRYLTAVVEYIPMQRWVHIAFVLQDDLLTVYMDGDIYTVKSVHDIYRPSVDERRPIFAGTSGDVVLGQRDQQDVNVYGFLSQLRFANYAMMPKDVKNIALSGPSPTNWLGFSMRDIPQYGFRSPVYRIEDE